MDLVLKLAAISKKNFGVSCDAASRSLTLAFLRMARVGVIHDVVYGVAFCVFVRVLHETTLAAHVTKVARTIDEFLLGELF
jgi:hypothetical protein